MFRFKETLNVDKNKLIFYRMSLLVHSLPNFHFPFPDSLYRILLENPHLRFYLSNLTVTASCFLGLVQGESMYFLVIYVHRNGISSERTPFTCTDCSSSITQLDPVQTANLIFIK